MSRGIFLKFCVFLSVVYFVVLPFAQLALAATSQVIQSTIRIPVCGDLVAESPEECDNSDLGSATCRSEGFDAGDLSCDIACELDTTSCYGVAPTPTPIPTSTPLSSTIPSSTAIPVTSTSVNAENQAAANVITTSTGTVPFQPEIVLTNLTPFPLLPSLLQLFDPDGNGAIQKGELPSIATLWVQEWQKYLESYKNSDLVNANVQCDINGDEWCNIIDFSVLLYYVEET